jgi:hypothetical protein
MNWNNSEDEEDDDFNNKNNQFAALTKSSGKNYDKFADDSGDDSDEKARVLKTPYEKAKEYITGAKKDVDKVKDDDFEDYIQYYRDVTKHYEKSKKDYDDELNKIFARILYKIEDKSNAVDKEKQKDLNKAKSTALNELRKLIKKNAKVYGDVVQNYKKNITQEEINEDHKPEEEK